MALTQAYSGHLDEDGVFHPDRPDNKPNLPSYSEDGVDLTLIRSMLRLTPEERISTLQSVVNSVTKIVSSTRGTD